MCIKCKLNLTCSHAWNQFDWTNCTLIERTLIDFYLHSFDLTYPHHIILIVVVSFDLIYRMWDPATWRCHFDRTSSNFVQSKSATSLACHVTQLWSTKISLIYFSLIIYFHNLSHLFVTKTTTSLEIHTQSEYYPFGSFKLSSLEINKLLINNPN
jgi:hypothetical protein